jgi:hypothetical protein
MEAALVVVLASLSVIPAGNLLVLYSATFAAFPLRPLR